MMTSQQLTDLMNETPGGAPYLCREIITLFMQIRYGEGDHRQHFVEAGYCIDAPSYLPSGCTQGNVWKDGKVYPTDPATLRVGG